MQQVCSSLPKDKPKHEFRDMIRGWTETRGTKVPSTLCFGGMHSALCREERTAYITVQRVM